VVVLLPLRRIFFHFWVLISVFICKLNLLYRLYHNLIAPRGGLWLSLHLLSVESWTISLHQEEVCGLACIFCTESCTQGPWSSVCGNDPWNPKTPLGTHDMIIS
jgi:hypothetical protein